MLAPTSQRVLVVGATGMLGSLVAKEAAAKGHRVTALVSERSHGDPGKKSAIEELTAAGVELAKGSLESPQSVLVELAKKADVVRSRAHDAFMFAHVQSCRHHLAANGARAPADYLRGHEGGDGGAGQPCTRGRGRGQREAVLPLRVWHPGRCGCALGQPAILAACSMERGTTQRRKALRASHA